MSRQGLTRREFIPRAAAAALGAGALLCPAVSAVTASATRPMKYRKLGQTGMTVSEISFGSHLHAANRADPEGRAAQIHRGLELGINLFDIYEHTYGQFAPMSQLLRPVRQDVLISLTSVTGKIMAEVESSLTTFATDTIDLYRVYAGDNATDASMDALGARLSVLRQAKEQGKIRAFGVSGHDQRMLVSALHHYPELDYILFPYNFRHRRLDPVDEPAPAHSQPAGAGFRDCTAVPCPDPGFAAAVSEHGVGLIAMKPFAGGGLLRLKPADPRLEPLADAGVSLPQAALKFILQTPRIACTIPAMNSIAEVEENVAAVHGGGLSEPQGQYLEIYDEAAEQSDGEYLPDKYRWLEQYKA